MRRLALTCVAVWLAFACEARGDGGAVRLSRKAGAYHVTVFTDPTPLRVGGADVSVLVQDGAGKPALGVPVTLRVYPVEAPDEGTEVAATSEAATNKLLRAAQVRLARAGRWRFEVTVADAPAVAFEAAVEPPAPPWQSYALWIGWPALVVTVFALRRAAGGESGRSSKMRG